MRGIARSKYAIVKVPIVRQPVLLFDPVQGLPEALTSASIPIGYVVEVLRGRARHYIGRDGYVATRAEEAQPFVSEQVAQNAADAWARAEEMGLERFGAGGGR